MVNRLELLQSLIALVVALQLTAVLRFIAPWCPPCIASYLVSRALNTVASATSTEPSRMRNATLPGSPACQPYTFNNDAARPAYLVMCCNSARERQALCLYFFRNMHACVLRVCEPLEGGRLIFSCRILLFSSFLACLRRTVAFMDTISTNNRIQFSFARAISTW